MCSCSHSPLPSGVASFTGVCGEGRKYDSPTTTSRASGSVLYYLTDSRFAHFYCFPPVFRRFIWNFFRLENEHLNNCGQFRAVRDISVVPMETHDEVYLEQLMDDVDGLALSKRKLNRRRKSSVVVKSLRKISSHTDGVRANTNIVIENETETRV